MTEYQLEKRPDGTNIHRFGDVTLAGMEQIERYENRKGAVVIGGDKGDVWADSAWRGEEDGEPAVVLCEAEFRTSLNVARGDALAYLKARPPNRQGQEAAPCRTLETNYDTGIL